MWSVSLGSGWLKEFTILGWKEEELKIALSEVARWSQKGVHARSPKLCDTEGMYMDREQVMDFVNDTNGGV